MKRFQIVSFLVFCDKFAPKNYLNRALLHSSKVMAKSKYDYVKTFESDDKLLPNCWLVVRLDGKGFHKFADLHDFTKPNDKRALDLMNKCATTVMKDFKEIVLAYGQSDEYSFIFRKETALYGRRAFKILTTVNSLFSSSYVYHWSEFFGSVKMKYPASFDARIVLYPSDDNLRDYLCWRQADVHINNLYNTCFWSLVQIKNLTNAQAEERLRGTLSSHKNEILFSEFGINYNNEPLLFRKGTTLLKKLVHSDAETGKLQKAVFPFYSDFFQQSFWDEHPEIFGQDPGLVHYVYKDNCSGGSQHLVCDKCQENVPDNNLSMKSVSESVKSLQEK